jgi:adenosylcobinamide-GDP ribazoletransferase
MAGSVPPMAALVSVLAALTVALLGATGLAGLAGLADAAGTTEVALAVLVAAVCAGGAAVLLARHCVARFSGVTGDVYGACVELAFTVALVVPALLLP